MSTPFHFNLSPSSPQPSRSQGQDPSNGRRALSSLCCCWKSGISRKVSRQGSPTFICEATAILMKLDCVRPRHRKLSPDGRWTDMEFEFSAEMEKRESIRRRGSFSQKWTCRHLSSCRLHVPPYVNLKKLLNGLKPRSRTV